LWEKKEEKGAGAGELTREGRRHDVAGLADFVVADDAMGEVFALLGGARRGVISSVG
jgi:hypothetical protein